MKKLNLLAVILLTVFSFACNSNTENEVVEAESTALKYSELKEGQKLEGLVIERLESDARTQAIYFSGEYLVEGKLNFSPAPSILSIDKSLISSEIDFNGNVIDLSKEGIYTFNSDEILKYLPKEYIGSAPDGWTLKDEYNGKIDIKVIVKKLVFETASPFRFGGDVEKVISINGNENLEIASNKSEDIILPIENIVKGDKIKDFEVLSVEYQKAYMYQIALKGNLETKGNLSYNEFEETFEFEIDDELVPQIKLVVEESNYLLFKYLIFSNINELKKNLNAEELQKLAAGELVPISITVNDIVAENYLDKGRLALASAIFVKLN